MPDSVHCATVNLLSQQWPWLFFPFKNINIRTAPTFSRVHHTTSKNDKKIHLISKPISSLTICINRCNKSHYIYIIMEITYTVTYYSNDTKHLFLHEKKNTPGMHAGHTTFEWKLDLWKMAISWHVNGASLMSVLGTKRGKWHLLSERLPFNLWTLVQEYTISPDWGRGEGVNGAYMYLFITYDANFNNLVIFTS